MSYGAYFPVSQIYATHLEHRWQPITECNEKREQPWKTLKVSGARRHHDNVVSAQAIYPQMWKVDAS